MPGRILRKHDIVKRDRATRTDSLTEDLNYKDERAIQELIDALNKKLEAFRKHSAHITGPIDKNQRATSAEAFATKS